MYFWNGESILSVRLLLLPLFLPIVVRVRVKVLADTLPRTLWVGLPRSRASWDVFSFCSGEFDVPVKAVVMQVDFLAACDVLNEDFEELEVRVLSERHALNV